MLSSSMGSYEYDSGRDLEMYVMLGVNDIIMLSWYETEIVREIKKGHNHMSKLCSMFHILASGRQKRHLVRLSS